MEMFIQKPQSYVVGKLHATNNKLDRRGGFAPLSWGGWGWGGVDDNVLWACRHVGCYGTAHVLRACTHVGCYGTAHVLWACKHVGCYAWNRLWSRLLVSGKVRLWSLILVDVTFFGTFNMCKRLGWSRSMSLTVLVGRGDVNVRWTCARHACFWVTCSRRTCHADVNVPSTCETAFLQLLRLSTKHGCSPKSTCAQRRRRARVVVCFQKMWFFEVGFCCFVLWLDKIDLMTVAMQLLFEL